MNIDALKIDPRVRRTRQMLFQAFQDLLVEKAFDQISVQDLADRSTLNRATFYDHFTDKFDLLEAMIGARFRALIEARMSGSEPTCEAALKQLILAVRRIQRKSHPLRSPPRRLAQAQGKVPGTKSHHGKLGYHRRRSAMESGQENVFGCLGRSYPAHAAYGVGS
jgi:AcrR family transcriptional regulator